MSICVVIPTYNGSDFITKAIESVLSQTRFADEIIVIDDGSTDNTCEIVSHYPVRLIKQTNKGVSLARNRAINESKSEWIAFLDQDDWYHPQKLEIQEATLCPEVVLSYSHWINVPSTPGQANVLPTPNDVKKTLTYKNVFPPGVAIIRRSSLVKVGGFNPNVHGCEDWELWVRLLDEGEFVAAENALLYIYSHSANFSKRPEHMLRAVKSAMPTLVKNNSGWHKTIAIDRIMAAQYISAALMCRGENEVKAFAYCLLSFLLYPWPKPLYNRHKILAAQVFRIIKLSPKLFFR